MVAIIDYGVGNLFSLKSSFDAIGEKAFVTNNVRDIENSDKIILPGVGAFCDAKRKLKESGMEQVVISEVKRQKPLLGICLGMQLLFEKSYEYGEHQGMGLVQGEVVPFSGVLSKEYKIPHIGWNSLKFHGKKSAIFKYINDGDFVYFVHSFYGTNCNDSVIAYTDYGIDVTAAIEKDNIFGCQFHPEKSGEVGLKILKAFCEVK